MDKTDLVALQNLFFSAVFTGKIIALEQTLITRLLLPCTHYSGDLIETMLYVILLNKALV